MNALVNTVNLKLFQLWMTIAPFMDENGGGIGGENTSWSLENLFKNARSTMLSVGGIFISLLGAVMIVIGGYKIAKGLISHGKDQTNWFIVALLIIVGGAFLTGGITLLTNLASGGMSTINDMATNSSGAIFFGW